MKVFFSIFFSLIFFVITANALSPEERLTDELQEKRAMNLFLEVRCLVCSGQVIESSDTEFSFQMRKLIRGKISLGQSDEEIKSDLTKEFGENILVKPNLQSQFLLWLLPVVFALGLGFFLLRIKK
jgi:cytochrome c-type biogenesis protein CcmH